jgi:PKD repeat protein
MSRSARAFALPSPSVADDTAAERRSSAARRVIVSLLAAVLSLGALTAFVPAATADTAPPAAGALETVSTDALPAPQIDGVVWDQVVIGNVVYVGGDFTTARPPGSKAGENTVPRSNFLAYDLVTGDLITTFAPAFNAQVRALAASPDGTRLYAAGSFTSVDGRTRYRVAAFDVATGSLVTSFNPTVNSRVNAIVATDATVYLGGIFSSVQKQTRPGLAALAAATGAIQPFAPAPAGGEVRALALDPSASELVVGGSFTTLNGSSDPGYGLASVDATTGELRPFAVNSIVRNGGAEAAITSLVGDATGVYGTGYVYGDNGNFEGGFRASWNGGALVWMEDCHGDSYSIVPAGDLAYVAGHPHYCGNLSTGGFPDRVAPSKWYRGLAFTNSAVGTLTANKVGPYASFTGQPAPALQHWFPDMNTGLFTGAGQGPWDVTTAGGYVLYGGEFTQVNKRGQQGLVRFATKDVAPNDDGPQLSGAEIVPTATAIGTGAVRLKWTANYDRDNSDLRYEVIRDDATATPIAVNRATSNFWTKPALYAVDTGLTVGQAYSYRIRTIDPFGNSTVGDPVTFTAVEGFGVTATGYDRTVLADVPSTYWPLSEKSGTTAFDWRVVNDLRLSSAVTRGSAGAEATGDGIAATFPGTSGASGYGATKSTAPSTLSTEAWFSTTSTRGGVITAFSTATGSGGSTDFATYLDAGGRVTFGVTGGVARTVRSAAAYNDGSWHHVVSTATPNGLRLSIDGALVAEATDLPARTSSLSGYWRVGTASLVGWANRPLSDTLAARVDNVAVYPRALTTAQIEAHFLAGSTVPNIAPTAAIDSESTGLDVFFSSERSGDSDGSIVDTAWSFGDGTTGSGATVTHTYATAGTYEVTVTVTDDDGATATATTSVSVAPVGVLADDTFSRSAVDGWGTAEAGGLWTVAGGKTGFAVGDGTGTISLPAGGMRTARLPGVVATDVDVSAVFGLSTVADGGGTTVTVVGRQVGTFTYSSRIIVSATGAVRLQIMQGTTALASVNVAGLVYAPGDQLTLRLQATGSSPTTLSAAVWKVGAPQPATWQLTAVDSTADLQAAGTVGVNGYVSGSATNGPVVVRFDSFRVALPQ